MSEFLTTLLRLSICILDLYYYAPLIAASAPTIAERGMFLRKAFHAPVQYAQHFVNSLHPDICNSISGQPI